jgi:asparagine synthase (glutamine-hydrolysing)
MCGICGIIDPQQRIEPSVIHDMTMSLRHRGPDGQVTKQLSGAWLGHARLSIIDLVTGDQPMTDSTGRWWIVFNGEIYNYRELRAQLQNDGCVFRTQSDTEVILQGYLRWGKGFIPRLNGQFVFAVWDTQEKTLFAARDRFGEKPLHWAVTDQGELFFASEIKAILAINYIKPRLDLQSVDLYLSLYYVPPSRTIYRNIQTLLPAHTMTWKNGKVQTESYWHPTFSTNATISEEDAIEQTRVLVRDAVHRQMVSDVPIGAFLSGGLDSSTVVAHMSEVSERPVKTFSVGFGDLINELPYAREIADRYKTEHHEIQMDISVGEMLEKMAMVYDEPFADSSNIPTYLLSQFASKHVKVCLSGDGGDEIFGGYSWYSMLWDKTETKENTLLERLIGASMRLMGTAKNDLWEARLRIATLLDFDRSNLWLDSFQPDETLRLLRSTYGLVHPLQGMDPASAFDIQCYLPGDILVKVDRAALAHGLESRAPFLDTELTEFILNLPWQLRFKDKDKLKFLLRRATQHLWTESIKKRDKQGFGAPIDAWLARDDVKPIVARALNPNSALRSLLKGLTPEAYEKSIHAQKWTLLCLALWLENHAESM